MNHEWYSITRNGEVLDLGSYQMLWIDAEKEAEIGVGTDWPYTDLKNDECIFNAKKFHDDVSNGDQLEIGDKLTLTGELRIFWGTVATEYNEWATDYNYPWMPAGYLVDPNL